MNKPTVNQQRLTVSKKFQLEQWDRLCPLTEFERLSIQSIQRSIQSNISTNILQSHQSHQSSSSSSSSDSNTATQASSSSDCQTNNHQETIPPPSPSSSSTTSDRPIRPESNSKDEPIVISSISHFNDWFSSISDQIQADSEAQVLDHLSSISTYRRSCDRIESSIDRSSNLLESIRSDWNFIDLNSRSLESSSETILEDHKRLNLLACRLEERLNFFRCLEDFQKFLSLPGQDELISHPEFVPMIERLDQSLEFIKSNRHFRDADLYLVRFQQCLTRSMTLIKLYYSSQVQSLTESINFKLSQNSQSASILSPLVQSMLYQKFEGLSNQLFPLINQIERRFKVDKEEYGSILYEMFSTWFSVRNQLLGNFLKIEIRQMAIDHNQVPDLIRLGAVGCNFMRSICNSEYRLFRSMFKESGTEEVFSYLESLCDHLYDLLRPQILHEQRLEVLCALATSVNALIAMDSDLLDIEPHDAQNQTVVSDSFNFSLLLRPILQDIQTRLIFRAQSIIQTEVANYQPKKSDLDYPSKLIVSGDETAECGEARKGAPGEGSEEILIRSALRFRLPSEDVQQLWYPTLKKTLWVLSKLHTYVNVNISLLYLTLSYKK
ncbi:Sec34-like family-domain-containing protein [Phakopsora pachyrhizi]|nr:Sec34-like family-domain-containing protein [Phakopsora pachyrhizi]